MTSIDPTKRILDLREKVLRGEAITLDEAREAVELLRQYTTSHAVVKKEQNSKKGLASPDFDLDSLFDKKGS